jgi:hypothetical protein
MTKRLGGLRAGVESSLAHKARDQGVLHRHYPAALVPSNDPVFGQAIQYVNWRRVAIGKARDHNLAGVTVIKGGYKTAIPVFLAYPAYASK